MMAQQQQMFAGQAAYSQQISAQMPGPYQGTLGARGFGGGMTPGGYAYGAGGGMGGYGPGNSFGDRMTSGLGGVASAGFGAMGILGSIAGAGGGLGGMLAGGAIGYGVGAIGQHVVGSMMTGAQEQSGMERTLSQFNFQNPMSRTGQGFNRQDSMGIGNMVRQMERVPEMLTSFGELNKLMDKMGQMGLMQGVRDAGEFQKKFRDTIGTLKEMSKILGGTMEDALQAFGEARRSGIYSGTDIAKNAIARRVTGSLTGMNQGQVGALQMYGGDLGHATGGSRRTGAMLLTRTAGQLGMANQMGVLSNDQIMEMTGKEGAEGIQDLAGSMGQLSYRMSQSNVGTALSLALGAQKDGRYTGEMDQDLVERVRRGELSLGELKQMARKKASTRGAKLSFAAHRARITSEMAGSVGAEGMGMQLKEILGSRGWDNPDATNLVMQRFGASEEQANLLQQLMPNMESISLQMGGAARQEGKDAARNAAISQNYSWDAIKKKITTKIRHITTDKFKDLGVEIRDYFQNYADEFIDSLTGAYRVEATQRGANIFRQATAGNRSMQQYANSLTANAGGNREIGLTDSGMGLKNMGKGLLNWLGGGTDPGSAMAQQLSGLDNGKYVRRRQVADNSAMSYVLGGLGVMGAGTKTQEYTTTGDLRDASARYRSLGGGEGESIRAKIQSEEGGTYSILGRGMEEALTSTQVLYAKTSQERMAAIESRMRETVSADFAKGAKMAGGSQNLILALQKDKRFSNLISTASADELAGNTDAFARFGDIGGVAARIKESRKELAKSMTGDERHLSYDEIESMVSSDSGVGRLLMGTPGGNDGLLSGGLPATLLLKATFDADDRKLLASKGLSQKEIDALEKDVEGRKKLHATVQDMGGGTKAKFRQAMKDKDLMSFMKLAEDFKGRGLDIKQATNLEGSNRDNLNRLSRVTKGKTDAFISRLNRVGTEYSEGKFDAGVADMAGLAGDYAGADAATQRELDRFLSGAGLGDIAALGKGRAGFNKRRKSIGKGGMELGKFLGGMDETQLGSDLYKQVQGLAGSDGKVQDSEAQSIIDAIMKDKAGGLTAKKGAVAGAAGVSEQDVANSLKTMSDNNVKVAQILGNLAAGKTGKDAMEGVSTGGK